SRPPRSRSRKRRSQKARRSRKPPRQKKLQPRRKLLPRVASPKRPAEASESDSRAPKSGGRLRGHPSQRRVRSRRSGGGSRRRKVEAGTFPAACRDRRPQDRGRKGCSGGASDLHERIGSGGSLLV